MKTFIFDTFDFDFCKASYDGKTLAVANPESILKRNCIYYGDKEAFKYAASEFTLDERLIRLQSTYDIRQGKYESRGFLIENKFDFGDKFKSMIIANDKIEQFIDEFKRLLSKHNMMPYPSTIPSHSNGRKGYIWVDRPIRELDAKLKPILINALNDINRDVVRPSLLGSEIKSMLNEYMPGCTFVFNRLGVNECINVKHPLLERELNPIQVPKLFMVGTSDSDEYDWWENSNSDESDT